MRLIYRNTISGVFRLCPLADETVAAEIPPNEEVEHMRSLVLSFALMAVGCTREAPSTGGGDPGPLTTPAGGPIGGVNGDNGGGDTGGGNPAQLPALMSGNYQALSTGLLQNNCLTTPAGSDLGTWAVKVVNPTVWNVTVDQSMPIAVLDLNGVLFTGETGDEGMPIYGCTMQETWHLELTPTSTTAADGTIKMTLTNVSGDCSQYEPMLPCSTQYQVGMTKAN
jgi:hypothetical protein